MVTKEKRNTRANKLEDLLEKFNKADLGIEIIPKKTFDSFNAKQDPTLFCDAVMVLSKNYAEIIENYKIFVEKFGYTHIDTNAIMNAVFVGRAEGIPDEQIVKDLYDPLENE